ncbi:hypothetical protein V8J88_03965 [Massilia sp. W12]|uniref:hypothetical protein n=1 Tax=Massilia sp. W12 TaxID=3126507 RepID=UPI0030D59D94
MPKTRKPRRDAHRAAINAKRGMGGLFLLQRRQPTDPDRARAMKIANHLALANMTSAANPTESDWANVGGALNFGQVLAEMGHIDGNPDAVAIFQRALQAAHACQMRAATGAAWRFYGPELHAINEAMTLHDAQIDACCQRDFDLADAEILRRFQAGNTFENLQPLQAA